MAEQDIGKRFRFPKGQQRTFIKSCVNRLGATSRRLAEFANVSVRTVTDWKREKFLLPVSVARKLSKKSGVALPSGIKTEGRYWYTFKGGKEGGYAVYNQYGRVGGDEEARKKKDFKTADKIRYELKEKGIILEDTKEGTVWRRRI